MVYLIFKEKFRGKNIRGTYARKFKTLKQAKMEIQAWNGLTERDKIIPLAVSKEKPKGFKKNQYGVLKKQ